MAVVPILIATHEYEWSIKIFSLLFSKYWGDETVIYFGDRQDGDLPSNIEFRRVPAYLEGVWPWHYWFGNGLKSICEAMTGNIIVLFFADHWLNMSVNKAVVESLENYLLHRPGVFRANLTADRSWDNAEYVEEWNGLDIIEVKPWDIHAGLNGGVTFCPSLWKPEILMRLVESHWNLWECEKLGTERVKLNHGAIAAVGSNPAALRRTHALVHSRAKVINVSGLSPDDLELVKPYFPEGWITTN